MSWKNTRTTPRVDCVGINLYYVPTDIYLKMSWLLKIITQNIIILS